MQILLMMLIACKEEPTQSLNIDGDGDGFTESEGDCDDRNPNAYPGAAELDSADLCMVDEDDDGYGDDSFFVDGGASGSDCDDSDPGTISDMDCDGVLAEDDCDDSDASMPSDDVDCDGILTEDDCDDFDPDITVPPTEDADGDGLLCMDDCDDSDSSITLTRQSDPECDFFYLAANDITVLCPQVSAGERGYVNGVEYTKRDRAGLQSASDSELATTCTSGVTDMSELFQNRGSFNGDIGSWDVGSVTNMNVMFSYTSSFNQNISGWDVSNVMDMSYMFYEARSFNQELGDWNVSNVTNMSGMFCDAHSFNQDIGGWDVSNVTNMRNMFSHARAFNQVAQAMWSISEVIVLCAECQLHSPGTPWHGTERRTRRFMARPGTENHSTENLGTAWHGKCWHGKILARHGPEI